MGNSEVEQICRQIYKKHSKALDLIFQYKPDVALEVSEYVQMLLNKEEETIIDSAGKTVIRFTTKVVDNKFKKVGEGWSSSGRIVMFEFYNYENRLALRLYIGPGEQNYRNTLIDIFKTNPNLFNLTNRAFGKKWHAVYAKDFLKKRDYENKTIEDIKPMINKRFAEFLDGDLKEIEQFISNIKD